MLEQVLRTDHVNESRRRWISPQQLDMFDIAAETCPVAVPECGPDRDIETNWHWGSYGVQPPRDPCGEDTGYRL